MSIRAPRSCTQCEELLIEDLEPFEDILCSRSHLLTSIGLAAAEVCALQAHESLVLAGLLQLVSDCQLVANDLVLRIEAKIWILHQMEKQA